MVIGKDVAIGADNESGAGYGITDRLAPNICRYIPVDANDRFQICRIYLGCGNSVLDILLTGKSLYCQKHSIDLTVVADGHPLGMMDMMDICTIFGNALDNAIECELKLPDKGKRMIHLTLTTQKKFLLLQVENYCPDPPAFRNGIPMTTKQDVLLKTRENAVILSECAAFTKDYPIPVEGAIYYLCENGACKAPASEFRQLKI